jgi:surface polysaccharide O-acyltransferase-like enzyme
MKKAVQEDWILWGRIIGAFAVVSIHATALISQELELDSYNWWITTIVVALSVWAVPVFTMISGALLLTKVSNPTEFYKNRLIKIGIPTVIAITAYYLLYHFFNNGPLNIHSFVFSILYGQVGHLYFLLMILELYILTPFLQRIVQKLSYIEVLFISLLFFFVAAFWGLSRFSLTLFIPYLGYYLAGFVLSQTSTSEKYFKYLYAGWGISFAFLLLTVILGSYLKIESFYYFTHGNPLIAVFSVFTFRLFQHNLLLPQLKNIFTTEKLRSFSHTTLGVYLIHPAIILLLEKMGVSKLDHWYYLFILIPVIFTSSYLLSQLFATISACLQRKFFSHQQP